MQGNFWSSALDPPADEEVQHAVRDIESAARRGREAIAMRDGSRGIPALPGVDAGPIDTTYLTPPVRFQLGKRLELFVLKSPAANEPPRPARIGHYLVPCLVDVASKTARPFKKQQAENNPPLVLERGFPGVRLNGDPVDAQPRPDLKWCVEGRDFERAGPGPHWEIGLTCLQRSLEEAEALDLAFARRMEGLGNVASTVVWDCIDPDYDVSDREAVMAQFMSKHMEKFYAKLDAGSGPSIEAVSAEALHKHKAFCKAWTEKHYRTLTPVVTAAAEALASEFYPHLQSAMAPRRLTRMELARVLMRHEDFAPEFASALNYFTANLEQTRVGRNPNYKQMRMMSAARVTSYASLGTLLANKRGVLNQVNTFP
jgi:hypothetical protein